MRASITYLPSLLLLYHVVSGIAIMLTSCFVFVSLHEELDSHSAPEQLLLLMLPWVLLLLMLLLWFCSATVMLLWYCESNNDKQLLLTTDDLTGCTPGRERRRHPK
jgi:hypothetical protein